MRNDERSVRPEEPAIPDPQIQKLIQGSAFLQELLGELVSEAYVFGYPAVLMDLIRRVSTNVDRPTVGAAPVNQLSHSRSFPDETTPTLFTPNTDALSTTAFVDLSREPMVLTVPEMSGRYYAIQMLDGWTEVFASLGPRTTGTSQAHFAIIGPRQAGRLPDIVNIVKSPTDSAWIIGRIQTNNKKDYAAVHALQDRVRLTPLSVWGRSYTPTYSMPMDKTVDMNTPPAMQVARMGAASFFPRLNALMKNNPTPPSDAEAINRFAGLGIGPKETFEFKNVSLPIWRGIAEGVRKGHAKIVAEANKPNGRVTNGWHALRNAGRWQADYLSRAVATLIDLGPGLPEDITCLRATSDSDGQPLTGATRYEIRFERGDTPPVNAFWSISLYSPSQRFVKNPIHRYAIGDRDRLRFNDDGSLTLYVRSDAPGAAWDSNWLPSPRDSFNLIMRLYWPKTETLTGRWLPPIVRRVEAAKHQTA